MLHSAFYFTLNALFALNPIQDGDRGQKEPPISFSPVISANVEISPKNFLTLFPHW